MKMEYLTAKEIAARLGVVGLTGIPQSRVIVEILNRLGIHPLVKGQGKKYYPASALPEIRKWFYQEELPEIVMDQWERNNHVMYVTCSSGKPVFEEVM